MSGHTLVGQGLDHGCHSLVAAQTIDLNACTTRTDMRTQPVQTVVLLQSCEAGGHGANGASLVTLIPELVDHVQSLCQKLDIQPVTPVVAAGGIVDARQV